MDAQSGVVHSLAPSTAKVHDSQKFDALPHGDETAAFGGRHRSAIARSDDGDGCVSAEGEAAFRDAGKIRGVMRKAPPGGALHPDDVYINRVISSPAVARTGGASAGNSGRGSSTPFRW